MRLLHTMIRVSDIDTSIHFYCDLLGLRETRRKEFESGRFTLVFLAAPSDYDRATNENSSELELTWNWDGDTLGSSSTRNFGHLAYEVDDIYALCQNLSDNGVVINRPPRDGRMAFVRSPDGISIELLQKGDALTPQEPWSSMQNEGEW